MDIKGNLNSTGTLHGCTFDPRQNLDHPYPSLVLDGSSYADIPLTAAAVGATDSNWGMRIISLVMYVHIETNADEVLFEYKANGTVYFRVTLNNLYPIIIPRMPGCPASGSGDTQLSIGWNELAIIRTYGSGTFIIYLGNKQILSFAGECDNKFDIPVPGILRVGASHSDSGYLNGMVSCLRLFTELISSGDMSGGANDCIDNTPGWNFIDADLLSGCKKTTTVKEETTTWAHQTSTTPGTTVSGTTTVANQRPTTKAGEFMRTSKELTTRMSTTYHEGTTQYESTVGTKILTSPTNWTAAVFSTSLGSTRSTTDLTSLTSTGKGTTQYESTMGTKIPPRTTNHTTIDAYSISRTFTSSTTGLAGSTTTEQDQTRSNVSSEGQHNITTDIQTTTHLYSTSRTSNTFAPNTSLATTSAKALLLNNLSSQCRCICVTKYTEEESSTFLSKLLNSIHVDKRNTSAYKRKFISVWDERPSAQAIGYLGAIFIVVIPVVLALSDSTRIYMDFMTLIRTIKNHFA